MSRTHEPPPTQVRLDDDSIDRLARTLAALLRPGPAVEAHAPTRDTPQRLLSATEVSEWWGVERGWVYAHANDLGAIQLGSGRRPRLRFDPDRVAAHLNALDRSSPPKPTSPPPSVRRFGAIAVDEPLVPYEPD